VKKVKWEEMLPHELAAAREAFPVAYVAIGPLEYHSKHLPLGTDPLKAYYHVCRVAEAAGGVVYPPLYLAKDSVNHGELPLRSETDGTDLLKKVLESKFAFIAANGFEVILVMNGHGFNNQVKDVEEAARTVADAKGITIFVTQDERHCDDNLYRGDHAGGEETSMMLHIRPDLVDLAQHPAHPEPFDELEKNIIHSPKPDPRTQSSAEYGQKSCEQITARLAEKVRELLVQTKE
jgi:creatinine amidohydrolase